MLLWFRRRNQRNYRPSDTEHSAADTSNFFLFYFFLYAASKSEPCLRNLCHHLHPHSGPSSTAGSRLLSSLSFSSSWSQPFTSLPTSPTPTKNNTNRNKIHKEPTPNNLNNSLDLHLRWRGSNPSVSTHTPTDPNNLHFRCKMPYHLRPMKDKNNNTTLFCPDLPQSCKGSSPSTFTITSPQTPPMNPRNIIWSTMKCPKLMNRRNTVWRTQQ